MPGRFLGLSNLLLPGLLPRLLVSWSRILSGLVRRTVLLGSRRLAPRRVGRGLPPELGVCRQVWSSARLRLVHRQRLLLAGLLRLSLLHRVPGLLPGIRLPLV